MPVEMQWYNPEKTIYHAQYIGNWTWDELYRALENANRDFDTVKHKVDVLQDWSRCGKFPPNIVSNSRNLIDKMHPNAGISMMVGGSMLLKSLWQVFSQLNTFTTGKRTFLFANTLEEAVHIIEIERKRGASKAP